MIFKAEVAFCRDIPSHETIPIPGIIIIPRFYDRRYSRIFGIFHSGFFRDFEIFGFFDLAQN